MTTLKNVVLSQITALRQPQPEVPWPANLPAEQTDLPNPFETFDRTVHDVAHAACGVVREWCYATHRGQALGLVLWSEKNQDADGNVRGYGCGKTHLARAAYEYLMGCSVEGLYGIRKPLRVTFRNSAEFYGQIRDLYGLNRPEYPLFNEWGSGAFILDDLGSEYVKSDSIGWAQEKFYRLIDRLCDRHSFLITTNLNPESIEQLVGGKSWSRLAGMCGLKGFVDMSGIPDYRTRNV